MTTGTIKSVTSKPVRSFVVTVPGPPPADVPFNDDVSADDLLVVCTAFAKGATVSVSGTPPTCGGVTAQ